MSSSSPSLKPDVTLSLNLSSNFPDNHAVKPEERGMKLIQLLLTCANHASSGNLHRADACLRRISQLASISGDSVQRLATWFASALAMRLVKRWPGMYKALNHGAPTDTELNRTKSIFVEAFPYLGFTYAVITRTLIETMSGERVIHIVDLGSGDPKLWVPLLRTLSKGPLGVGPPQVKITCVNSNQLVLNKLGFKLIKEARSLDMSTFQYNPIHASLRELTMEMFNQMSGEALAFVSILNLHTLLSDDDRVEVHFGLGKNNNVKDRKNINDFITMIRAMSPKTMLLVEQESDHNLTRLVDRFVEALHYYSAIFDSIDSILSSSIEERIALEKMFGREIENIVACEGLDRVERHEKYSKWMFIFGRGGFKPVRLWFIEDAKRIVEAYGSDGYKIVNQRASLMICWHDRPIYCVSAWTCFN